MDKVYKELKQLVKESGVEVRLVASQPRPLSPASRIGLDSDIVIIDYFDLLRRPR